jgi:hypothetical protein
MNKYGRTLTRSSNGGTENKRIGGGCKPIRNPHELAFELQI